MTRTSRAADPSAEPVGTGPVPWPLAAVASLLWAALCDLVLEASLGWERSASASWRVALGIAFCWCLVLLLIGLTGRLRAAFTLSLLVALLVAAVNVVKLEMRATPLLPSDVDFASQAGFLAGVVPVGVLLGWLAVVAATVTVVWVVGGRMGRRYRARAAGEHGWRRSLAVRATLVVVCSAAIWHAGSFNQPGNLWRSAYELPEPAWKDWSQVVNYEVNGFVGGSLYNLPTTAMPVPPGYSASAMAEVAARYRSSPAAGRDADALDRTNVVIVLSESFADPTSLDGISLEDPIPHTRKVIDSDWGGRLLTPVYGGGTATTEFEVLTGQVSALLSPQVSTPFQHVVAPQDDYPSVAGWLRDRGHHTVAVHPYHPGMYQRSTVYPVLGFDEFVDLETMRGAEQIAPGPYVSDRATYDEVVRQVRESADPVLVHTVTMQNHVPMPDYPDAVPVEAVGDRDADLGRWARGLAHTDDALPALLEALAATGEPSVLVFFGDHFPSVLGDELVAANPGLATWTTPFFVWSSSEEVAARDLGVTSPTNLVPLALERAGIALPPYLELVRRVGSEVGTLRSDGVVTPQGHQVGYGDLSPEQAQLVADLRLVQYDFSIGERHALREMWQ